MTREEAMQILREMQPKFARYDREVRQQIAIRMAIQALKEQKVGHWIFGETMGHSWMKCSECCVSQDGQTACFTYCPNCGAKMEGAEE